MTGMPQTFPVPTLVALGDSSLLVRFGTTLTDAANRAAIAFVAVLDHNPIPGVVEIMPNLVSVLLRYDPAVSSLTTISGHVRLALAGLADLPLEPKHWTLPIHFDGPDIESVAAALGMEVAAFITAHNLAPLRVLATGFAPGFVYCGLHDGMVLPRREAIRPTVPAGSVLFAAGQTAIAATDMPTGWHVIGHTDFRNFDPLADPPTRLGAGDMIRFTVAA